MARVSTLLFSLYYCSTVLNAAVISSSMSLSPSQLTTTVDPTPSQSCPGTTTTCTMTLTIESTATPIITLTSTLWTDTTVVHLVKRSLASSTTVATEFISPSATMQVPLPSATPELPTREELLKNKIKKWSVGQKTKGAFEYVVDILKRAVTYSVGVIMTPIAYVQQG